MPDISFSLTDEEFSLSISQSQEEGNRGRILTWKEILRGLEETQARIRTVVPADALK